MKNAANWVASLFLASAIGCTGAPKAEVSEDFSDLAQLDEKSDSFSYRMKIVGSLDYGQTSDSTRYTQNPRYRAFKFGGHKGDQVDIWVRSSKGDSVAWLLDNAFNIVAQNDDSGGSVDSHITATLPGNTNPDIVTYYIVFRDYWLETRYFTVALTGTPANDFYNCALDSDCVKVQAECCAFRGFTSVRAGQEAAYKSALACPEPTICPAIAIMPNFDVAQCNNSSHKCELIAPEDIACGGRIWGGNAHDCPAGWSCYGTNRLVDGTDKCVQQCGGFAARPCNISGTECQDDTSDSCDPDHGGADCGGLCLPPPAPVSDCRTTGCGAGRYCTYCWVNWACIPEGALC